ncbi:MAG: tRNA-(ms[2]io[6]A)-hydroxylase [Bacteroidota bacterium]
MKLSADLVVASPQAWIGAVLDDFDTFLQDHANCERKASAMAMSFVAKYPDRVEIIPELIETAVEELEHFQQVYAIMEKRGVRLPASMDQDLYIKDLLSHCRSGREERFIDRMLLASVVECRGAERFRMVYENLEPGELKTFYHHLWASEAKHGHIFVKMLFHYFEQAPIYKRLDEMVAIEADILHALPIRPALH